MSSGTAGFTPTQQGKFVLAFQTTEYDRFNGTQMGYIRRDAQVIVLGCSGAPPNIDTAPVNLIGATLTSIEPPVVTVCPGSTVSFSTTASSNTIVNQVYLSANTYDVSQNNPSTFTVVGQGTSNATGTFTWTPNGLDVGDHTLIITAKDSTCNNNQPIVLKSYLVVLIKVLPSISAGPDTTYCPPYGLPAGLSVTSPAGLNLPYTWTAIPGGSPTSTLSCTTCDSPSATPTTTTDYEVVTFTSAVVLCRTRDTVRVTVIPSGIFDAGPDRAICLNDTIQLTPTIPAGVTPKWLPAPFISDTLAQNPKVYPQNPTTYVLTGAGTNGCRYRDSVRVDVTGVRPQVMAFAGRDTVCPEGGTQLYSVVTQQACGLAQSVCVGGVNEDKTLGTSAAQATLQSPFFSANFSGGGFLQILYRKEELEAAGVRAGFINSIAFNVAAKTTTAAFADLTVYMGCTQEAEFSPSTGAFIAPAIPGIVPVRTGSYTTAVGWNTLNFPVPYYWDGNSNLTVQLCGTKTYGVNQGTTDAVFASNSAGGFNSVRHFSTTGGYYPGNSTTPGSFCNNTYTFGTATLSVSTLRPNTRFNICSGPTWNYSWSPNAYLNDPTIPNPTVSGINVDQQYVLTVTAASNAACSTNDTVNIKIDRTNAVDATPDMPFVLCRPDYVQLNATGIGPRPRFFPDCGIDGPMPGSIASADSSFIGSGVASNNVQVSPYYGGTYRTSKMQMLVRATELKAAGVEPGALRSLSFLVAGFPTPGTFNNFRISLKCTEQQSISTAEGFQAGATQVYNGATVTAQSGWNEYVFDQAYNWNGSSNLLVEVCYVNTANNAVNQNVQFTDAGFPSMIRNYASSGNACTGTGSFTNFSSSLRPNMRFRHTPSGDTDFTFTWVPGTFLSDSTAQSPLAYVPETSKWYVYTQGRNECRVRDSVEIYVPNNNFNVGPKDTAICFGESIRFNTTGRGNSFVWYENGFNTPTSLSCSDCATPIATPQNTTTYTLVIADSVNCADTFTTRIVIKPLPLVDILQGDTLIKYGQSVNIRVTGANDYYWTPAASLSAAVGTAVVASPLETTTYVVSGLATTGCRSLDSVTIRVDPSDNLFVPSAFSPNGDGKNEVFKVANITFQKLMEFRIFNRYGQEIFSTTDGKRGWDGTWKGVPQDMGVYQYMIRVAFPDGLVETYKGDVTLVR